jgi:hypothetical protein
MLPTDPPQQQAKQYGIKPKSKRFLISMLKQIWERLNEMPDSDGDESESNGTARVFCEMGQGLRAGDI